MKSALLYIGIACIAAGCGNRHFSPREGDLYFQIGASSEFSEAITEVTEGAAGMDFSHVGIVTYENGAPCILEALPAGGVRLTPLAEFLSSSALVGGRPGVVVFRLKGDRNEIARRAAMRARTYLGQPYDFAFLPRNGALYCSELVWESYRDEQGEPIFTARPMTFCPPGSTRPADYWTRYFKERGMPVPEGVSGTNPGDVSREACLEMVYRYF